MKLGRRAVAVFLLSVAFLMGGLTGMALEEALGIDWFELNGARLQVGPYSVPHMDVAVASSFSPAGPISAGKHGVGMLSVTASQPGGMTNAAGGWKLAEEHAEKNGTTVHRDNWRVLTSMHLAETREEAIADIREGATYFYEEYFGRTLGSPAGTDFTFEGMVEEQLVVEGLCFLIWPVAALEVVRLDELA